MPFCLPLIVLRKRGYNTRSQYFDLEQFNCRLEPLKYYRATDIKKYQGTCTSLAWQSHYSISEVPFPPHDRLHHLSHCTSITLILPSLPLPTDPDPLLLRHLRVSF